MQKLFQIQHSVLTMEQNHNRFIRLRNAGVTNDVNLAETLVTVKFAARTALPIFFSKFQ